MDQTQKLGSEFERINIAFANMANEFIRMSVTCEEAASAARMFAGILPEIKLPWYRRIALKIETRYYDVIDWVSGEWLRSE